jgi:glutathione S-transferase
MMKLFFSPTSPYVRKVRISAIEKGVFDQIEEVLSAPMDNSPDLHATNPLGKIPALVLGNGDTLYDSPVICEYLDSLSSKNPLIPTDFKRRLEVKKTEALGDGLIDALVARHYEFMRPENERSQKWISRWEAGIKRVIDVLEQGGEKLPDGVNVGAISLAAALGYLNLRYEAFGLASYPKVNAWFTAFEKRESMQKTMPPK